MRIEQSRFLFVAIIWMCFGLVWPAAVKCDQPNSEADGQAVKYYEVGDLRLAVPEPFQLDYWNTILQPGSEDYVLMRENPYRRPGDGDFEFMAAYSGLQAQAAKECEPREAREVCKWEKDMGGFFEQPGKMVSYVIAPDEFIIFILIKLSNGYLEFNRIYNMPTPFATAEIFEQFQAAAKKSMIETIKLHLKSYHWSEPVRPSKTPVFKTRHGFIDLEPSHIQNPGFHLSFSSRESKAKLDFSSNKSSESCFDAVSDHIKSGMTLGSITEMYSEQPVFTLRSAQLADRFGFELRIESTYDYGPKPSVVEFLWFESAAQVDEPGESPLMKIALIEPEGSGELDRLIASLGNVWQTVMEKTRKIDWGKPASSNEPG